MKLTLRPLLISLTILCGSLTVASQAMIKPFQIVKSNLIEEVKKAKAANPKLTAAELVIIANKLLDEHGLNFNLSLDAATCAKIQQVIANQKDKTAPLNLRATLRSPVGENANVFLPELSFSNENCGPCFITMPVFEATANEFVTTILGRKIKFALPANFVMNEAALVDAKDLTAIRTRWKIPFRTTPLSVSDSGNILYAAFAEPELSELVLMAYGEGVYQFGTRNDIDAEKKGALVKDAPADPADPRRTFIKFTAPENIVQVVRFSAPCKS